MKKLFFLLLAVMMLLACLPAMADEPTWKVIKTTGVVKCSNSTKVEGHITIPAEVDGINRVLYDLTPKPIGTIEWE